MSKGGKRRGGGARPPENKIKRIDAIDALRGLAVILMVIHHGLLDLVVIMDAPGWLFSNPVFDFLHYIFAGVFVILSGVSSRFSRSNLIRGVRCFTLALVISAVSALVGSPILFGVLHLLGLSMVIFAVAQPYLDRIPLNIQPVIYFILMVVSGWAVNNLSIGSAAKFLFFFGWTYPGFSSADWFPLFPWIFVFLMGTWLGVYIKQRKFPKRFYTFTMPILPQIGRKSLLIYMLHQPILYGVIYGIRLISRAI